MATLDDSVKHAFVELKTKQQRSYANLQMVEEQMRARSAAKRRSVLTGQELQLMPEDANMYKGIGRAYVLTPRIDLLGELAGAAESADQDIKALEGSHDSLVKEMQHLKEEINELARSHPALMNFVRAEMA